MISSVVNWPRRTCSLTAIGSWRTCGTDSLPISEDNPAQGHCDVTCLVVNDLIGGELAAADVFLDGHRIMAHMWNRLPSDLGRQPRPGALRCDLPRRQ